MLSVDKSRGVNFSSMCMYVDSARSSRTRAPWGRSARSLSLSLALPSYVRNNAHKCARARILLSSSFHKPARAFTDGKLADGQGGIGSLYTVGHKNSCGLYKRAFTSFKVVASSSKVGWERRRECDRTAPTTVIEKMIRAIVSNRRKSLPPLSQRRLNQTGRLLYIVTISLFLALGETPDVKVLISRRGYWYWISNRSGETCNYC